MKAAMGGGGAGQPEEAVDVAGVKLVAREVSGLDKDGLRALVDQHRARIKSGVVVLAAPSDGKVSIVVGVTPDLTKKVPAGQVVKQLAPIVGGGGGGRPDFAEAGGKDPSKIGEMLARRTRHRREDDHRRAVKARLTTREPLPRASRLRPSRAGRPPSSAYPAEDRRHRPREPGTRSLLLQVHFSPYSDSNLFRNVRTRTRM